MEYKLKKVHLNADSAGNVEFPDLKDRVIEKYGDVLEFSLSDVEENVKSLTKTKTELEAKLKYEQMRKENVEHHHPFVLELSEENRFAAHMYQEACQWVKICNEKLALIEEQLKKDAEEIEEIKKQIPELASVESPYANQA